MSKVLIGVVSGMFIGAILYELFTRACQNKALDEACCKHDEPCAVQPDATATN